MGKLSKLYKKRKQLVSWVVFFEEKGKEMTYSMHDPPLCEKSLFGQPLFCSHMSQKLASLIESTDLPRWSSNKLEEAQPLFCSLMHINHNGMAAK